MILRTAVCLTATLALAGGRPKPAAKPAARAAAVRPDASVPAVGAAGERIDAGAARGRAIPTFLEARADFQATPLGDGRVLVSGGTARPSSECYDPAQNRFLPGPALTVARTGHRAIALKDGRVLLVGGTEKPSPAELLEPAATAFKPLPGAAFGLSAEAVELDDGRVLLIDGASGALWTFDGKRMSGKGTLARPRLLFRATKLKDGKVAITGGWPSEQKLRGRKPATGPLPVEVFNPRWSTLSSWSALPLPRARHQAVLLEDGRVALWGGVGLDPDQAVADLELLDPARETLAKGQPLDLQGHPCPAFVQAGGRGLHLAEQSRLVLACAGPQDLASAKPFARLANGYLNPVLAPLPDGGLLVLGAPAYGLPVDRWDPRTRQGSVLTTLRQDAEGLGLLPDGKVLALGPVVDLLDPRTGSLAPLGWREDLGALLKTCRPATSLAGAPPFRPGQARTGAAVVALDKGRALVVGGEGPEGPSSEVAIWDVKKKSLAPAGSLKIRRAAPGALKLGDGSVLVWGAGKE